MPISTSTWLDAKLIKPSTQDLPIWVATNGVIDLFSFSLPTTMDYWMPATLPDPPKRKMEDAEKAVRLASLIDTVASAVEAVRKLSVVGEPTGADADYLIIAIESAYSRKKEICGETT